MTEPRDPRVGQELSSDEKRRLLKKVLEERAAAGEEGPFPLSYGQQALWFLHRLAPESAAYNWIFEARIMSPIDTEVLSQAVGLLVERHQQLRVCFSEQDEGPRQQVLPAAIVPVELCDASSWSEEELDREIRSEASRPFDLTTGPVIRFRLFRRSDRDHVLLIVAHHIVMDGRSIRVLMQELSAHYTSLQATGKPSVAPPAGGTYREFVRWEEQMLAGPQGDRLADFWREQLEGAPTALDLPTDFPRPEVQRFQRRFPSVCACRMESRLGLASWRRQEKTSLVRGDPGGPGYSAVALYRTRRSADWDSHGHSHPEVVRAHGGVLCQSSGAEKSPLGGVVDPGVDPPGSGDAPGGSRPPGLSVRPSRGEAASPPRLQPLADIPGHARLAQGGAGCRSTGLARSGQAGSGDHRTAAAGRGLRPLPGDQRNQPAAWRGLLKYDTALFKSRDDLSDGRPPPVGSGVDGRGPRAAAWEAFPC